MDRKTFKNSLPRLTDALENNGAFITAKNGDEVNTMTIGWAIEGISWNKPILVVLVRYSRHTYEVIKNSPDFTVSVPKLGELKEALAFCGTKSGRDYDKFKECCLTLKKSKSVNTPIIGECDLHYECKIAYAQTMDPNLIRADFINNQYKNNNDFHVMYFGEVVECYTTD